MPLSRRLRYEILRRDDHACRYCGAKAPDVPLTVDHVMPTALGGSDDPTNLVTACKDCNAGKASSSPDSPIVENVSDDALRWSNAMAAATSIQAAKREEVNAYIKTLDDYWCRWTDGTDQPVERPADWRQTFDHWYSLGLELPVVMEAIEAALTNTRIYNSKAWRYCCGICWNRLRERQDMAREIMDAEDAE